MILMRDQNFFFDCASGDLTPGQVAKVILRSTWPESDIEIMEQELRKEQENAQSKRSKKQ